MAISAGSARDENRMASLAQSGGPDPRPPSVGADRFRELLSRHAAGVVVITALNERPAGFTATSFTSVSMRPPLVSFCLDRSSSSWPVFRVATYVGVHFLAASQQEIAQTFATRRIDRFAVHPYWHPGPYGVPILEGVPAWMIGRVVTRAEAGDHTIVLSEVVASEHDGESGPPLIYHKGHYL